MSRKTRLIKTTVYIRHDQINELEGADFNELEQALKQLCSKNGSGKSCVSIVRIIPAFVSTNTVDVEFVAFNEDIDFLEEEDVINELTNLIDSYIDVDISHIMIKQVADPIVIMGDLS